MALCNTVGQSHKPATDTRSSITAILVEAEGKPLTRMEICDRTGLSYFQVRDQVRSLIGLGRVQWGNSGKQRIYWIAVLLVMLFPVSISQPSWDDRDRNITAT